MQKQNTFCLDDSWIDQLYAWANTNGIPDLHYVYSDYEDETGSMVEDGFWIGLPRNREELLSMEELDLSWHNVDEIPEQIRHLTQLRALRFSKQRDGVQPPFAKNLGHKKHKEIPWWIADLKQLVEIDLSGNEIEYIPERFCSLTNLERVYLGYNRISYIHSSFSKLTSMKILHLQCNQLCALKDEQSILALNNLSELWFDGETGSEYGPKRLDG